MTPFHGRRAELESLELLTRKKSASLVVLRGRRRIGKSRLIREFGKLLPHHIFSGLPPTKGTSRQGQLDVMCDQIAEAFNIPSFRVDNWGKLFNYLAQLCSSGPFMLALDEISWMGSTDPNFLGHLKNAWDLHFSRNPKLILILCGSVSSWIERNILGSTGFVGRISLDISLKQLALDEATHFWGSQIANTSSSQLLKVLAVTGGVPRYLEEVQPHLTAEENIARLCFNPTGLLHREFEDIFTDLFSKKGPTYRQILQQLALGPKTIADLQRATDSSRRMTVSEALSDLASAGFVSEESAWNFRTLRVSRLKRFRLSDNYTRFYLMCIAPAKERGSKAVDLPSWHTTIGLQFENLVLANSRSVLPSLHLDPSKIACIGGYLQRATKRQRGCQVDLLVQTHSRVLYLCEIKFQSNPVGMKAAAELREKRRRLVVPHGFSTRLALIHVNGVTDNLPKADAIDHIVDFGNLLNSDKG